jgi:hypothetical protein
MKMKSLKCALGMLTPGPYYLPDHPRILPHRPPPLPRGPVHPKLVPHHTNITQTFLQFIVGEQLTAPSCARPVQTRSLSLSRSLHQLS